MAKKKKKIPGLNTSSTADISFMLLIFFLITTSMDTDKGLARRLPKPPEDNQEDATMDIKARNILYVRVNMNGELFIDDELNGPQMGFDIKKLRNYVKDFVRNRDNNPKWPEVFNRTIELIDGPRPVTANHIISVQTDRGTPYDIYFQIQNELIAAYNELRDEISKKEFHREYALLKKDEKEAIRSIYPQNISEAEPKKYAEGK